MAHVMGICAGPVGPKSENVEKVLVFKAFLKGQDGPEDASAANNGARNSGFGVALGIRR